jgi:hypothetical protein
VPGYGRGPGTEEGQAWMRAMHGKGDIHGRGDRHGRGSGFDEGHAW